MGIPNRWSLRFQIYHLTRVQLWLVYDLTQIKLNKDSRANRQQGNSSSLYSGKNFLRFCVPGKNKKNKLILPFNKHVHRKMRIFQRLVFTIKTKIKRIILTWPAILSRSLVPWEVSLRPLRYTGEWGEKMVKNQHTAKWIIYFLKTWSMFLCFIYPNPRFPGFDVFSRQQKDLLRLGAHSIHKILFTFKWDPTSPEAPTWQPIETSFWSMLEKLSDSTAACGF